MFAELPALQRLAVDRVLLKAESNVQVTDQRVAAAAFVAVVDALAAQSPVLIAIDGAQWLDPSSRTVIAYAVRRFHGHVGVLASERLEPDEGFAHQWLQLNQNDEPRRIRLRPLGTGVLHSVISAKLGRSLPRPVMTRIHEISGGTRCMHSNWPVPWTARQFSSSPDCPRL